MRSYLLTTITSALLLLPSGVTGQQPQKMGGQMPDMLAMHCGGGMTAMAGMPGMAGNHAMPGMEGMMETMMGPPAPGMILEHKQDLKLTPAQVSRLEKLQKMAQPECAAHMQLAMSSHLAANTLLDAPRPNFPAYVAKMKEASAQMIDGMVVMAKAAVAARDILTPAQRRTLKETMDRMHKK